MNRKSVAKQLLKMNGIKLPVSYDSDYFAKYTDDKFTKIYVQRPNQKMPKEQMEIENATYEYTNQLMFERNVLCSYHFFAILHEIGHVINGSIDSEKYETDSELLKELYIQSKLSTKDYVRLYNSIEDEQKANEFAINWLKKNKNIVKLLDN